MSPEVLAQLHAVAALPDDQINTSDIPEVRDWSGAVRGKFYHPVKERLTLEIDSDVVEYFREQSKGGYQAAINRALRASMLRAVRRRRNQSAGEEVEQERAKG
jgi:uncharacterized protein (DUF4415 family)